MTKLVERFLIEIEMEDNPLYPPPREQLHAVWGALEKFIDAKGKWTLSGPSYVCQIINLGVEEVPETEGSDN